MFEQYIQNDFWRALLVFVLVFIFVRIVIFILSRVIPVFTKKTKTNLDDEILRRSSIPLTIIAAIVGIRFAIGEFNLNETWDMTLEGIVWTLLIIVGGFLVYSLIDALIVVGFREFKSKAKGRFNESLVNFFHSVLKISVFIAVFLIILANWGVQIGPLLAGIGVAGIAIAFALQSTLSNIFAGVSMLLDKSISIGDVIKLSDGTMGKIVKINLRSTKVNTFDNELIIVPNSKLADSNIQNIALPEPKSRVVIPFGVSYGSNIEKVKKIVMAEIKKVKHFIDDPEPIVRFLEMANSSLNFKAFFYIDSYENRFASLDEANTRIYNALNKNNISIPFPQMDVHLKKGKS